MLLIVPAKPLTCGHQKIPAMHSCTAAAPALGVRAPSLIDTLDI